MYLRQSHAEVCVSSVFIRVLKIWLMEAAMPSWCFWHYLQCSREQCVETEHMQAVQHTWKWLRKELEAWGNILLRRISRIKSWFWCPRDVSFFQQWQGLGKYIPYLRSDVCFLVAAVTETLTIKAESARFLSFGRKRGRISSWDGKEGQYLVSFTAVSPDWEMIWFHIALLYLLLIRCSATPSSNSSISVTWGNLGMGVGLAF